MQMDMPFTESTFLESRRPKILSPCAPIKKKLFLHHHTNTNSYGIDNGNGDGVNSYHDNVFKTPNPKGMVGGTTDGHPIVDLINANCSPVTCLAAELDTSLEIEDGSSKTPRKSLLAELSQKSSSNKEFSKPNLPAISTKRPNLSCDFEFGTTSHWNRRGTQAVGSRGINLPSIPVQLGQIGRNSRAPVSAPPLLQSMPEAKSTMNAQKRAAGEFDRHTLVSSPKKNIRASSSKDSMMEDCMDLDFNAHNQNPRAKMRRTSSASSFQEDEMAYVLPSPDSVIPVGFSMSQEILPFVDTKDTFRCISPDTLVDLLDGKYNDQMDYLRIVDCRFPYEFDGGHIAGAINIHTPVDMAKAFFHPPSTDKRVLIVFHCEFSYERAPKMASRLRKIDRSMNLSHYPHLVYPEVYLLKGGYQSFFATYKERCFPQEYVEMNHEGYRNQYRQGVAVHRRDFRKTKSFS